MVIFKSKNFRDGFQIKFILVIFLTALSLSVSLYFILYNQFYSLMINGLKNEAKTVNKYISEVLGGNIFNELKTIDDEKKEIYAQTHAKLDEVRRIANIRYLYTAARNEKGEYIYVVDGLSYDSEDFRHVGDLIEEEIIPSLMRCLDNEEVMGKRIMDTDWGLVYVAYFPVYDSDGNVAGAVGIEFDCSELYESISRTKVITIAVSIVVLAIFTLIAIFASKKISVPFYKKLAYQDALTGLANRMAFEEHMKEHERRVKKDGGLTIIVFDLNNLKTINDTTGHHMGDTYIKNSAKAIAREFDGVGITYRIGGDEFATIVTEHPAEEIDKALKSLYSGKNMVIKNMAFDCAYGMAVFDPELDKDPHDLFVRADSIMYENKRMDKEAAS